MASVVRCGHFRTDWTVVVMAEGEYSVAYCRDCREAVRWYRGRFHAEALDRAAGAGGLA